MTENLYHDLKGKTAVITGGSQGIGYAIAETYCRNGAGVALVDISETALKGAASRLRKEYPDMPAETFACDIADAKDVAAAFGAIAGVFKRIDVLVNNAGILRRSLIETMAGDDWNAVIAVNLTGVFHCCRAVLPAMKRSGTGVIVNVSSNVAALPSVGMGAYCVSKAGVETLTKVLAAEYAPYGIRVNAYAPGVVETEMTKDILQQRAEEKLRTIPIGRFTTPDEIADLVMFLSSDASRSIDGSVVAIDGGMLATHNPWKARP